MARALLVSLALTLAACSGGGEPSQALDGKDARAEAAIENVVAQEGAHRAARSGLPVSAPAVVAQRKTLPVAFQGYWGVTPEDCALTAPDARGRLAIDGDMLRFVDGRARIAAILRATPTEAVIDVRIRSEGATSTRRTTLSLIDGGTALIRTEQGGARPVRYQHC